MNKKQYEAMRKKLMDEAEGLINEGKIKEADSKMDEVKALDEKWDAIAQAQANFKALNEEPKPANVFEQNGSKADFGAFYTKWLLPDMLCNLNIRTRDQYAI